MRPRARQRAFRRMSVLADPTSPVVVHIRPRSLDKLMDGNRVEAAAWWHALEPALLRFIELAK